MGVNIVLNMTLTLLNLINILVSKIRSQFFRMNV